MRNKIASLTEAVLSGMDQTAVQFLIEGVSETEIREANPTLAEAILAKAQTPAEKPVTETVNVSEAIQAEIAKIREEERCARLLESKLDANKDLGQTVLGLIREQFTGRTFGENELTAKINAVREQAGKERPNLPRVYAGDVVISEATDKQRLRLEAFFRGHDVKDKAGHTVRPFRSFRYEVLPAFGIDSNDSQACREALGMMAWAGDLSRATEAVSVSSFDAAWADALYRVLMDAARSPEFGTWRQWTRIVSANDFSTDRKFVRVGGYGNFSAVAENGAYGSVTTPADEQVAVKPSKYGGIETISWEAILRDDVALISQIPGKLGTAWARTIHDVVYASVQSNSGSGDVMAYDSANLYSAGHANVVDATLSASSLISARTKMMSQTELSSGKRLGIRPRFLLHATPDLDQTAWELVGQGAKVTSNQDSTVANFLANQGIQLVPVIYPTSTTTRWELIADPADLVAGYVAFLNGREDPEIFVSDMDTQGNKFSNDQIKIKLRGAVGYTHADHRAFVRGNTN